VSWLDIGAQALACSRRGRFSDKRLVRGYAGISAGQSLRSALATLPRLCFLPMMVVVTGTAKIKPHCRTIIGRGIIIWIRWRVGVGRVSSDSRGHWRRRGRRLVHVEEDLLRNVIFGREVAAGLKHTSLNKLIGRQGQRADNVVIGTKVVKSAVLITKDFQMQRGLADDLSVGLDLGAWGRGVDGNVIGDGAMGTVFEIIGGRCRATIQQSKPRRGHSENQSLLHTYIRLRKISLNSTSPLPFAGKDPADNLFNRNFLYIDITNRQLIQ